MVASFKDKFGALRKMTTFRAQNGKINLRIKLRHPMVRARPLLLACHLFNP